jgi:ankyrin repeat protein
VFAASALLAGFEIYATAKGRAGDEQNNRGGLANSASFPDVEYSKLRITLQRSACFGMCPDYIVTISGDGSVVFTTDHRPLDPVAGVHREFSRSVGVLVPGTHRTKIDPNAVRALVKQFQDAGFFDLKNEYRYGATDAPTYAISIDTGHGSKRIIDYIGRQAGMPESVTALEDAIDKTAGTRRWIEGTPDAIPLLRAEGFRFDSPVGLDLVTKAAERGDIATLERLHELGAPFVDDPSSGPLVAAASTGQVKALSWLLSHGVGDDPKVLLGGLAAAVSSDSDEAFDRLRDLLGPKAITPEVATNLLREAAENANVRMVSYFLQFHPRLNGSADDRSIEDPPLWAAAQHSCPDEGLHPNCDHRKVVRMLLDAGADPEWFHPIYRNSVFFQVSDPEIAKLLLAHGADPNFKDSDGEPIIFSIHDEDVALVMIDAGLSLRSVRPADKMTLRGWATYEKWPRVLALLGKAGLMESHRR